MLVGDVWERPGLAPRDRSLITIATLIANGSTEQLVGHLKRGLANGITRDEVAEVITHLAFYAGWPRAMSAARVARQVLAEADDSPASSSITRSIVHLLAIALRYKTLAVW